VEELEVVVVDGSTDTGVDDVGAEVAGVSSAEGEELQAPAPRKMPAMNSAATTRRDTTGL